MLIPDDGVEHPIGSPSALRSGEVADPDSNRPQKSVEKSFRVSHLLNKRHRYAKANKSIQCAAQTPASVYVCLCVCVCVCVKHLLSELVQRYLASPPSLLKRDGFGYYSCGEQFPSKRGEGGQPPPPPPGPPPPVPVARAARGRAIAITGRAGPAAGGIGREVSPRDGSVTATGVSRDGAGKAPEMALCPNYLDIDCALIHKHVLPFPIASQWRG